MVVLDRSNGDDTTVQEVADEAGQSLLTAIPGAALPGDALADELIAFCRSRIAPFTCPTSVVFLDALPRLPSGKLATRLLPSAVRGMA